jgi:hypothetical protein
LLTGDYNFYIKTVKNDVSNDGSDQLMKWANTRPTKWIMLEDNSYLLKNTNNAGDLSTYNKISYKLNPGSLDVTTTTLSPVDEETFQFYNAFSSDT